MSEQWLRQVKLVVADQASALDISQLRVRFDVRHSDLQDPNSARIRVWNLAPSTQNKIQREFSRVILSVGYQDGPMGTLFDGSIVQVRRGRESAVDGYCDIVGADGDIALNFAMVNTVLGKGSTFNDRVKALAAAMGLPIAYMAPLPDTKFPRAVSLYGAPRDHMRDLAAATSTKWFVQDGQIIILPQDGALPGEAIVLTSRSGLIGFPQQTALGITARCLINPLIKPGTTVRIDNASVQQAQLNLSYTGVKENALLPSIADDGIYVVLLVNHVGDSRGQDWTSELVCLAPGSPLTPGLTNQLVPPAGYTANN
jgi:hypothetical protein